MNEQAAHFLQGSSSDRTILGGASLNDRTAFAAGDDAMALRR
jgi:hypothetical protein